jgi:hypothetical protein
MYVNMLFKVDDPDVPSDQASHVIAVYVNSEGKVEKHFSVGGKDLLAVSLRKDVFTVMKCEEVYRFGKGQIVQSVFLDSCNYIHIDDVPTEYREEIREILKSRDGNERLMESVLPMVEGHKHIYYISMLEDEFFKLKDAQAVVS